jgi:hypothetical protein
VFGLAASLLAVPVVCVLARWRIALLLCLGTAILQDPLRKLTPDQPVVFVVLVGVVFVAACLGALVRGISLNPFIMFRPYRQLAMPFFLLGLLIVLQAMHSYLRFENLMLPLTGLLTYVLPFFSIVFAYQLALREGDFRIRQFLTWYVVCIGLALTTVCLEYSGYESPTLGQVGEKFLIYDKLTGAVMQPSSGLFRASEIAAWHAMTAACFVVLIVLSRGVSLKRLLAAVVLAALLLAIGILTGRRKIILQFVVFAGTYYIVWAALQNRLSKLVIIGITGVALVGYAWFAAELTEEDRQSTRPQDVSYSIYVERARGVFGDAPARLVELGLAPVMWAYEEFGLFGIGLGTGTQGTQHFGGESMAAAEGGLGKIMTELGIPGLLLMAWLGAAIFRHLWRIMRAASRHSARLGGLTVGLFSALAANVAGFSVATQAYGDPFILLILSWALGFLLGVPLVIQREVRARRLALVRQHVPTLQALTA